MGSRAPRGRRPTPQRRLRPRAASRLLPSTRLGHVACLRSPSLMAASALPPTPTSMATAAMAVMAGLATVVAAEPSGPTARAHVHGVDDVVERLHEHAEHGRDGELQQQLERAGGPHAVDLRVAGALLVRARHGHGHLQVAGVEHRAALEGLLGGYLGRKGSGPARLPRRLRPPCGSPRSLSRSRSCYPARASDPRAPRAGCVRSRGFPGLSRQDLAARRSSPWNSTPAGCGSSRTKASIREPV